jgi:antitoxin VapB
LFFAPAQRWGGLHHSRRELGTYILHVYIPGGAMATAKVFRSGNSQAVRIPREFQFDTDEVDIERRGDEIILRRPVRNLRGAFDALAAFSDDVFGEGREDLPPQRRKGL